MITINANAKINLSLDVLNKREDGYHDLKMIMAEIPLYDVITAEKNDTIKVKTNLSFLPNNNKNTVFKAASEFFEYTKISGGINVYIEKNIPVSAGLAGGSADAAAALKALNKLYNTKLSQAEMEEVGNKIGKDVPFCLRGGICLAEGTGDKLFKLDKLPECYIVLIKPKKINVSTKMIFEALDAEKIELHPDTNGMINAIKARNLTGIARRMYNVLEDVTGRIYPEIYELKVSLIEGGALGAIMSGSGSSVFGIFNDMEKAQNTFYYLKNIDKQTYLLKIQ